MDCSYIEITIELFFSMEVVWMREFDRSGVGSAGSLGGWDGIGIRGDPF